MNTEQLKQLEKDLWTAADNSLRKANGQLVKIKNLLLPRLISGKLSVENLDIQFPPIMLEEDVAQGERKA